MVAGELISEKDKCPLCRGNKVTQEKMVLGGGGTIGCPLDKILVLKEPALLRFLFSVPANWCKNGHILLSIF
jgi:hypothetical protein